MFEWLFKYSRHAYAQGELVFGGELGWIWWIAAALLVGLSVVFARRLKGWPVARRFAVHGLQFAAVALLLTILAGPALQILRAAEGVNTVAVLVDTSSSMALPDANGASSRLDAAKRLVAEGIGGSEKTAIFQFDDRLRPAVFGGRVGCHGQAIAPRPCADRSHRQLRPGRVGRGSRADRRRANTG